MLTVAPNQEDQGNTMSGSSGGGSGGGGFFFGDGVACDRLHFETDVRSPNPTIVGQIQVGDDLTVGLDQTQAQAIVLMHQGQLVGGIASPQATRLRECLLEGTLYKATVITKRASNIVSVRITPSIL